jgi:hypothetical protein
MFKIKNFLLLAFSFFLISFNTIVFAEENQEIKDLASDFYEDIRERVEEKEKIRIEKRLELSSGIHGDVALAIAKGGSNAVTSEAIKDYCGDNSVVFSGIDVCKDNLKKLLRLDIDLEQLHTELQFATEVDEIWSNGTMSDSFFDLVVDLNLVDILLFGLEAEIPKSRWKKSSKGNDSLGGGKDIGDLLKDAPPAFFDTQNRTRDNNTNNFRDLKTANDDNVYLDIQGNIKDSRSDVFVLKARETIEKEVLQSSPRSSLIHSVVLDSENLQCRNPSEFAILNVLEVPPLTGGGGTKSQNPQTKPPQDEIPDEEEGDEDDGDDDANNQNNRDPQESQNPQGTQGGESGSLESGPIVLKDIEKKEGCLYGGFYCPPPQGGRGNLNSSNDCDPMSGICKKCWDLESSVKYCMTWEFKMGSNDVLTSMEVVDSITGYIQAGNKSYTSLLGVGPLTPTEQQNQAGALTQVASLFQNPGMFISVKEKIPDLWSHEAKKVDLDQKAMIKYWERMRESEKDILDPSINSDVSIEEAFSQSESAQFIETQRKRFENDLQDRESQDDARKVYYKNVLQNINNFHTVFDAQFRKRMDTLPFSILTDSLNKCEQKDS